MKNKNLIKKRIMIISLFWAMALVFSLKVDASTYSDIDGHWAQFAIEEMTQNNVLNGYSDNTFKPDGNVTAAEWIKMLIVAGDYRLIREGNRIWPDFYLQTARAENLICEDEYDDYQVTLSRYDVIKIISRFIDLKNVKENKNIFTDLNSDFQEDVLKLVKLKVIKGYTDKTFKGENKVTRAEAVTILKRALEAKRNIAIEEHYDLNEISNKTDLSNYVTEMSKKDNESIIAYEIPNKKVLKIYDSGRYSHVWEYEINDQIIDIPKVNKMIQALISEGSYTKVIYVPSKYTINQLKILYGESESKIENGGMDFSFTYYEDKPYELSRISMEEKFSDACYMKIEVLKLWRDYSQYLQGNYIDEWKKKKLLDALEIEFGSSATKILNYIIQKNELYVSNESKGENYAEVKKIGKYTINFYQNAGDIPKFFISK